MGELVPGQRPPVRPSLTGLRVTDVTRLLASLAAQGKVFELAHPRLLTLNNEPAIVRTDSADAQRHAADCGGQRRHAEPDARS